MTYSRTALLRTVLSLSLVGSLFLGSVWLSLGLALVGLFWFPYSWEFLIVAVCVEALYGGGVHARTSSAFFPLFAFLLFVIVEASRTFVREEVLRR